MPQATHFRRACAIGLLLLTCAAGLHAQSPSLVDTLTDAPSGANSVLYADFPALLGVTGDGLYNLELLKKLREARVAADLNLSVMAPNWEAGYVTAIALPETKELAALKQGYVEEVQGKSVVWTPDSGYLVPLGGDLVGIVRPANRQLLGSWLKKTPPGAVSEFLKKSASEPTTYVSLMVAVDIRDWLSPAAVKQRLSTMPFLREANLDEISKLLADLEGVRVIVGKRNLDECIVTLQFSRSPAALEPYAKDLFQEVLSRVGVDLREAQNWKLTADKNSLAFRGHITAENIDMLLDCFSLQRRSVSNNPVAKSDPSVTKEASASLAYFRQIAEITNKVRDYTKRNGAATSTGYNDRMARRIDELGTLDVDAELLDYAAKVSRSLRGFVVQARSANVQAGVGQAQALSTSSGVGETYVPYSYGGGVGGFYGGYGGYYSGYAGYYNPNAPFDAANVVNMQSKGASSVMYNKITATIDELTGEIRRKMTEKYKVQF